MNVISFSHLIQIIPAVSKALYINLLTYSSWLVAGIWLIYTGIILLYKPTGQNNLLLDYFLGAVRVFIGIHALRNARRVARRAHEPEEMNIRLLTYILLLLIVIVPLFLMIAQTSMMIFGTYQPDEHFSENLGRLIFILFIYMFAIIYADWRLRTISVTVSSEK